MPPRTSVASLSRSLRLFNASSRSFCCSQCLAHRALARTSLRNRISALKDIRTGRYASTSHVLTHGEIYSKTGPPFITIAPATSINKPLEVAPSNKALHTALERLRTDAANHVDISRLGLALRSLQGKDGIVRIAVLAMDGRVHRVKKLVRLLLADPLAKQQSWEDELAESGDGDSVLIKYGEDGNAMQSSSQIRTLAIPSRTLQMHNLEILVSSLQLETAPSEFGLASRTHDAILVPGFNTQATSSGHHSHLTYPVHKTLLVGNGIGSLVDYGRFTASGSSSDIPADMVQLAIEAPNQTSEGDGSGAVLLDVGAGEHALASIRQSVSNALAWEHGWFKAGIPPLSTWLFAGLTSPDNVLKPVAKSLIQSVLDDTQTAIDSSTLAADLEARATTIPDSVRRKLLEATASWSEKAHEELRTELDLAFASKNWARLKWYKLFWRSDDVTMLLSEIMERRWLREAEKGAIYLAGRIEGAGLTSAKVDGKLLDVSVEPVASANGAAAIIAKALPAYPLHVPQTRQSLASITIPRLQALSQTLVLQTGIGMGVTSALTAMAYLGFANATLFEAGAVLAFGVVISLKRLQNKWEDAREYWQGEVREEGRKALKETEGGVREIVETGGVGVVDAVGIEDRRQASEAVDAVREALASKH